MIPFLSLQFDWTVVLYNVFKSISGKRSYIIPLKKQIHIRISSSISFIEKSEEYKPCNFPNFCRKRTEWKLWKTIIFWFFIWRRIPHLSEIILSPIISTDMVIQYCISLWRGETSLWNDKWFLPEVFGGNLIARPCRECYYIIWAFQIHSLDGYLLFVFHGIYVSEVKSN